MLNSNQSMNTFLHKTWTPLLPSFSQMQACVGHASEEAGQGLSSIMCII